MSNVDIKVGLSTGESGKEVLKLQEYLADFGYATLPGKASPEGDVYQGPELKPETFDSSTQAALETLQSRFGLAVSGMVDKATAELLRSPRCGVPDPSDMDGAFTARGRWPRTNLTYGFENSTPDLPLERVRQAFRIAADLWAAVSPLRLTEVPFNTNPDLKIRFRSGFHGTEIFAPFDGPGGVLAHAYFPVSGEIHFDEDEAWSDDEPPSGVDLATVAAHELGHALGLDHSGVREAIMFPWYGTSRRSLGSDDVEGIQFLYGRPSVRRTVSVPPVATRNADGRIEVFAVSSEGRLISQSQSSPNVWNRDWAQIGDVRLDGRLAAAQNRDGRLEVFGLDQAHALRHVWQETPGGRWAAFGDLGGSWTAGPAVAANADGRLEVFLRGTEAALHHRNQIAAGSTWTPFYGSLGQELTSAPAVTTLPDGRIQVVVKGADSMLFTRWQNTPGGGWSDWQRAGNGVYSAPPAILVDGPGAVYVMARGLDGGLWSARSRGGGSNWSNPGSHGGQLAEGSTVSAAINMLGGMELFARFGDGLLYHQWQLATPPYWSAWVSLGGPIVSDPTVTKSVDGRLEVFAHANDVSLFHRWQRGDGSWA